MESLYAAPMVFTELPPCVYECHCDCLWYGVFVSVLTVMSKEVTVHNVNQTVQLLLDQAARRNLQDELCIQLAVWTQNHDKPLKDTKIKMKKGNTIR